MDAPLNGSLQSLVQLAAALNLGLVAILSLFQVSFPKELAALATLAARVEELGRNSASPKRAPHIQTLQIRVLQLARETDAEMQRSSEKRLKLFTILAVGAALTSLLLLVCFSFAPDIQQEVWSKGLAVATLLPVVLYVFAPLMLDRRTISNIRRQRDALDEEYVELRTSQ